VAQACSVNVAFLHVRRSIDDHIWANIGAKLGNVGQVQRPWPLHAYMFDFGWARSVLSTEERTCYLRGTCSSSDMSRSVECRFAFRRRSTGSRAVCSARRRLRALRRWRRARAP